MEIPTSLLNYLHRLSSVQARELQSYLDYGSCITEDMLVELAKAKNLAELREVEK